MKTRLLSTLLLPLALAAGGCAPSEAPVEDLPTEATGSALSSATSNDRVIFQSNLYEARRNGASQVEIAWSNRNGTSRGVINLGGATYYRPTIAADKYNRFLVVAARGTDNALWTRISTDGNTWWDWRSRGGVLSDSPAAFATNDVVTVTVTGTDGRRYSVYTQNGNNDTGWTTWALNRGRELPLGTNILTSNAANGGRVLAALDASRPDVLRLRSGFTNFSYAELGEYVNRGVRTVIFDSTDEVWDVDNMIWQLFGKDIGGGTIANWCAIQQKVTCFFEVGNEPDRVFAWYNKREWQPGEPSSYWDPYQVKYRANQLIDRFNSQYRDSNQNLRLMISLPTMQTTHNYFEHFVTDSGQGALGYKYDAVGVHTYAGGNACIYPYHGNPEGSPGDMVFTIIDRAKQITDKPLYVTEAGINTAGLTNIGARFGLSTNENRWAEVGRRYAQGLSWFDDRDGRIKGVMYFQTDWTNSGFSVNGSSAYNIDSDWNNGDLPKHGHWAMGARAQDGECPVR